MTETPTTQPLGSETPTVEVTFDEFKRIDIRTAKVLEVSRVPNSARLLKLILDIGGQQKQCIAGVGAKYEPEQLKDKIIVVVVNLKPRSLMGLVSEVMLLAAAEGPEISVLTPDRPLNAGAKVT
ncbi:MAG: methionine--tRNA ligase subunit beta [Nitrososphaerota archaeon]|nr:methionine--tRNA ligase subunit beta [Nitrososphaerota archaeon]